MSSRRNPVTERDSDSKVPLSYQQQQLWFIDRLQGRSLEYNTMSGLRIDGSLNVDAFRRAVTTIVERHEALRTRFVLTDAGPEQVVETVTALTIPVDDLTAFEPIEQQARLANAVQQELDTPFVLSEGPLLRVRLLKLGDERWVCLRCAHHIVWDGWSSGIYHRELSTLYQTYCEGRENPLPPLTMQYPEFAMWQRSVPGDQVAQDLEYWRACLADYPEVLEIPTDRASSATDGTAAHVHDLWLSAEMADGVRALAKANGASLHMTLLAVLAALLARYSGQDDLMIGSPSAGRRDLVVEQMIGLFTNVLAIRLRPRRGMLFTELLAQTRDVVFDAQEHELAPFEHVVREIAPHRSAGRTPLFDVMFTTPGSPWRAPVLDGLNVELFTPSVLAGQFGLQLNAREAENGRIQLSWLASRQRFERWRLEQMATHYSRLLEAFVAEPHQDVWRVDLVTSSMSATEDAVTDPRSAPTSVLRLIETEALNHREAPAVVAGEQRVTYAGLVARAAAIARLLTAHGVTRGAVIGVALTRSIDSIASILAIWRVGATYLPIDLDGPVERTAKIMELAAPVLVLTSTEGALAFTPARAVSLDRLTVEASHDPADEVPSAALDHDDIAYVMYTSGSTGEPKGVPVDHGALVLFMSAIQHEVAFGAGDRHLAVSPTTFDISILELLLPLCHGGLVIIAQRDDARDPQRLKKLLTAHAVTSLQATPSHWSVIVDLCAEQLREIRVLCGGEALPKELAAKLVGFSTRVWNVYGPTEATIWATSHRVSEQDLTEAAPSTVPIGMPLPGFSVQVLDESMLPVPTGVTGELYIGGRAVARGYLNDPVRTDERFVPDPFRPGFSMFRTGDRVRAAIGGHLEFVGRTDGQVKIRGHRVELGEIEAVLRRQEGVTAAAVSCEKDVHLGMRLVGYVVGPCDEQRLRRDIARWLPDYMVPSAIVSLDTLPMTPHGKVDRKALPASQGPFRGDRQDVCTPLEAALCRIYADLLGVGVMGPDDNFFEIGGHSLLLIELAAHIVDQLQVEVPLGILFDKPTVRGCAEWIETQGNGAEIRAMPIPIQ